MFKFDVAEVYPWRLRCSETLVMLNIARRILQSRVSEWENSRFPVYDNDLIPPERYARATHV
jgi:hypothetical protein